MAGWGKSDALTDTSMNNHDDRIELIDDTAEARARFGENYGSFEFKLTRDQVEGLLAGKVVAFNINEREYAGFLSLKK
jgi:hypothetical protein